MARDDLITAYLGEMRAALLRERRASPRVLAEIEDHLRESAERREAAGAAPAHARREAVAAFGDPEQLALAFRDALSEGVVMGPFIRFTGLLGMLAPALVLAGVMWWSWVLYAAALALILFSAIGMVAVQPRDTRRIAAGALALVPIGLAVAPVADLVAKLAVFGGFLGCAAALLAGRALPRPAVLAMAGGVALFAAGVFTGVAELPMWLQAIAFALIAGGWMWASWSLWRTGHDRSAVPPQPAAA